MSIIVYAYLIYGDTLEFSIKKTSCETILYALVKMSFVIVFLGITINRYNKYWLKILKFTADNSSNETSSYYMTVYFVFGNLYFFSSYCLETYIWITSNVMGKMYLLHIPLSFITYLNFIQSSVMFNMLLIINDTFKSISSDMQDCVTNLTNICNYFKNMQIRFTIALNGCKYFNKLFGIEILLQTFLVITHLLDSLNFLTVQSSKNKLSYGNFVCILVVNLMHVVSKISTGVTCVSKFDSCR